VLIVNCTLTAYPQENAVNVPVRILFYNVENLFDTYDDIAGKDEEFLPDGTRRWTRKRYENKINSIYKTLIAAGSWSPPAVVGLCEVENRRVLEDLVHGTYLSRFDYDIVHEDSDDERGIDVCMIFRPDQARLLSYRYLKPYSVSGEALRTRSVLYAKLLVLGDTLHLLINHWPSRRGGVLTGESSRSRIALMIRHVTDSLGSISCGKARVLIMGDFNCPPDDHIMQSLAGQSQGKANENGLSLVNLAVKAGKSVKGTYKYRGAWETIDQMLASDHLLGCSKGLAADSLGFKVFSPEFLLCNDEKYTGSAPFSTYRGYRYQGGISDHLPVFLDLFLR